MSFAEAIKHIRCKSLLSQEAFAKMLGVSFTTVNRWETGKSKPSFKTLRVIDEAAGSGAWYGGARQEASRGKRQGAKGSGEISA